MSLSQKLHILLIDNEPERLGGLRALLEDAAVVVVRDPFDVDVSDLEGIDLVSVDEYLGEEWGAATSSEGRYGFPASIRNRDGLAVAASLRSQSRQAGVGEPRGYAVALHTAELGRLAEGLPAVRRESLTAAQHDLEWVFEWGHESFSERIIALARAVSSATANADAIRRDFGAEWLNVPTQSWADTARAQIEDCRPPAHGLSVNTDGRSVVRWLAHRILPYPTFLVDRYHAANLLGVSEESFDRFATSTYAADYAPEYSGPLATFHGKRWWRAALQQMLVDQGVYQWDIPADRAAILAERAEIELEPLTSEQPVVAYDIDGRVRTIDADASVAARLQADGWPVYADDPWGLITDIEDRADLRALVTQAERHKIDNAS